ncbi:MAG: glutaredoxin family protein [Halioglobus sp.]
MKLTLYGTSACHLCDIAEQILIQCQAGEIPFAYEKVDISDSDPLFERYGERIPVVQDEAGLELGWPFEPAEFVAWLAQ